MGLPAFEADYFFLGPLLQQRLQAVLPGIPVEVCEHPSQVLQADKREQVLMVMWAGDRVIDNEDGRSSGGRSQALEQRWLVMLARNDVSKQASTRIAAAGPTLSKVHKALSGWTPEGAARPMKRMNAPLQPTFTESKAVHPLGFGILLNL